MEAELRYFCLSAKLEKGWTDRDSSSNDKGGMHVMINGSG
jgi:hypothetical protein